jgi:hypothetical protein
VYRKKLDDKPEDWIEIKVLEKRLPPGHWLHSNLLSAIDVCYRWGRLPSEFGLCQPEDDLTFMMAYTNTKQSIDAIESHIREQEKK